MSMTVSGANYMGSVLQNTRTPGAEKPEQKGSVEKDAKTRQSAVSASMDRIDLGESGIAVSEVSRQQGVERAKQQKQSASPRMDTVEISEEGQAASAKAEVRQDTAAEAYQYEAEDLSKYTDTELKQMYRQGEITRQEYEEETGETLE